MYGILAREMGWSLIQFARSLEEALGVIVPGMCIVTDNSIPGDNMAGAVLVAEAIKIGVPGDRIYVHSGGFTHNSDRQELVLRQIFEKMAPGVSIYPKSDYQTTLRNWLSEKLAVGVDIEVKT